MFSNTGKNHRVGFAERQSSCWLTLMGVRRKVDLGRLQDAPPVPGDWVLIHVGFAMSKISEADAADQMRTLNMLGEVDAAMEEVRGYGLDYDIPDPSSRRWKQ